MERKIVIFKSFEEQEMHFLKYFFDLTPSERLQKLHELQLRNKEDFDKPGAKKITLRQNSEHHGHQAS
jgi:hypothetical protein